MGSIPLRTLLIVIAVVLALTLAGGAALAHGGAKEKLPAEEPMAEGPAAGEHADKEPIDEEQAAGEHEEKESMAEEPVAMPGGTREPTAMTLSLEESGQEEARALATLTDQAGQPVRGAKIAFYRQTTFGRLKLGTVSTDGKGTASFSLPVYPGQQVEVTAVFTGAQKLERAEAAADLSLPPAPASPRSRMLTQRPDPRFASILLLVVGGVWTAYLYVFTLLARIKRAGTPQP